MRPEIHPPLIAAICGATADYLVAKLLSHVDAIDPVARDQRVNEAVAGLRDVATLCADDLARYQKIIAGKAAEALAAAARVSEDALRAPAGRRAWLGAVHDQACTLFHRTMADYTNGAECSPLPMLTAQTMLIATVEACGQLGLPVKGAAKRQPTALRSFDPEDYPHPDIRRAMVAAAFTDDADSLAMLRDHQCSPDADQHGRISLFVSAISTDGEMRRQALLLAGQILAEDPGLLCQAPSSAPRPESGVTPGLTDHGRHLTRRI